jgi:tripartite-type tricarboxylate transporter receptor subunit TctC
VPDFVVTSWCAFAVPRGVPRAIIDRVSVGMREAAEDAAIQERFLQTGARVLWTTPEDAIAPIARAARERPMWREVVRLSGARLE